MYVHPFGEEMNKARRMAASQARRLAASGYEVLQIDLLGCGDSSGEFADARWELWRNDVRAALGWLAERNRGPVTLWGLRLGATLAAEVAAAPDLRIARLLLWQPILSGELFITQFLRLRLASEMLAAGAAQTGLQDLRARLAQGEVLEIGGYELHPELAQAVAGARLSDAAPPPVNAVEWLEVSAAESPRLTPAAQRVADAWRAQGLRVNATAVAGEPFWTTIEIAECAALLGATDEAMGREGAGTL